jgi:histidine ammonia-lyase
MKPILLDGESLTPDLAIQVSKGNISIGLCPEAEEKVQQSRTVIEEIVESGTITYGVNTGFGHLCNTAIDSDSLRELQTNLVRSHACGVGASMHPEEVLLMMVMRANSLAKGYSGIRVNSLKMLIDCINSGFVPKVPRIGSLGASGDLAPLAHVALGLLGEGDAHIRSKRSQRHGDFEGWRLTQASGALKLSGIKPLILEAKEGLSLINGTSQMCAWLTLTLQNVQRLTHASDAALATSIEAMKASIAPFNRLLHEARPHIGQKQCADRVRHHLRESDILISHENCDRVQDAYAFRCAPQVHGAIFEQFQRIKELLQIEINSATDNPLVLISPEEKSVISGGQFHGEILALTADNTALSLHELASISERRIDGLLGHQNSTLPSFLAVQPGLESGLMILQYVSAAVLSELRILATPATASNIPVSAGQEDHVSMGATACWKSLCASTLCAKVIAAELISACAALDLIPESPGLGVKKIHEFVRFHVKEHTHDRPLGDDIETIASLILEDDFFCSL